MSFKLGAQQLNAAPNRGAAYLQHISGKVAGLQAKVGSFQARRNNSNNFDGMQRGGTNSSKEEIDKKINAAVFKETLIKNQSKDKFWLGIQLKVNKIHEEESTRDTNKLQIEKQLQKYYDDFIIDKKQWLSKVYETNEQLTAVIIDIMMYSKYKIINGVSIEGVAEILTKAKVALLKIVQGAEFMKAVISLSNGQDQFQTQEFQSRTSSPVRIENIKEVSNPYTNLTQLTMIGNLFSQIGANIDAEECFAYYVAIHESLYGSDSVKVGQCYFLLGQFYDEQSIVIDKEIIMNEEQNNFTTETQQQQRNLMFSKAELSIKKACEIYKKHLGPNHRAVGDCLFTIALLYKHQLRLIKAQQGLQQALEVYQNGIGQKNLQCAHCFEELGKLAILQQEFNEAYSYLSSCLQIKRELFRYKPQHRELIQIHRLIQGLVAILESQLLHIREQKKPVSETMVKLKNKIEQALSLNFLEDEKSGKNQEPQIKPEKKETLILPQEDQQILEDISQALNKKSERHLVDYLDSKQSAARQHIDRLFNRKTYQSIELSSQEIELVSFISLVLTLSIDQQQLLVDSNKVDNIIPYLRQEFINSLDSLQKILMIESKLYQKRVPCYKIFEDIDQFKNFIKHNNSSLLMRTKDDDEMEQILIDIIQSEKIKDYKVQLTKSHFKAFKSLLQNQMPMKLFLFLLDESQKKSILEFFFVALFQDTNNLMASECFKMFSLHIWYFHTHNSFDCEHNNIDLSSGSFYHSLVRKLFVELSSDDMFSSLDAKTEGKVLQNLSIQQLILYKRVKISPLDVSLRDMFISSLNDFEAYLLYKSYLEAHLPNSYITGIDEDSHNHSDFSY